MNLWYKIRVCFSVVVRGFGHFLKKVLDIETRYILGRLKDMALDAVEALRDDPSVVSNSDKRRRAFDAIKNRAKKEGLNAKDHLINLALELAVAYIKKF